MWGLGPKETMAAELREDPNQRGGWAMGLFLKVNRLDFFVPKERETGFSFVSLVDAIRACLELDSLVTTRVRRWQSQQ
jgi:hypothetical protein